MTNWRPVLTPGRRRHLEALEDGQPHKVKGGGNAGFSCRKLGWCHFAVRVIATGEIGPYVSGPFYSEDGVKLYEFLDGSVEIITPAGLAVLAAAGV